MKGGNIYALAKILGHASPKITLDDYAHLSPQFVSDQRRVIIGMCLSGTADGDKSLRQVLAA